MEVRDEGDDVYEWRYVMRMMRELFLRIILWTGSKRQENLFIFLLNMDDMYRFPSPQQSAL